MTRPKPRQSSTPEDPSTAHPQAYQQGVDTANRVINERGSVQVRLKRISSALAMVAAHMENWPQVQGKNGLTDQQWARSAGYAHTLREFLEAQAS
jgi:hypothetical protein